MSGVGGSDGSPGSSGINTATVALYAKNSSATVAPTAFSGTFTYTFSTSTLSGGTLNGWSTSAPSITKGEYLWVRYATAASSSATDTIASTEFSDAVVSGVGGSDGPAGQSNHRIYIAASFNTPPNTPSTTTSGQTPTGGWSSTPVTLSTGQAQWQSDGTTPVGSTVTTWGTPYQSYLKVANLEAIAVKTGSLEVDDLIKIGANGNISSTGNTGYGSNGIFLGYSGTTYKFSVGTGDNMLKYDGSIITIPSATVIPDSSGVLFKSGSTGARMEIRTDSIRVYDTSGNLRVILGNLIV